MDALFYNSRGDRFYSGGGYNVPLTPVGAYTGIPIVFNITMVSENHAIIAWPNIQFTATASAPLRFENIPSQFVGNSVRTASPVAMLDYDTGGGPPAPDSIIGLLVMEPADQEMAFYPGAVVTVGAILRTGTGNFLIGQEYLIYEGSMTFTRSFV
jgi:hypothetical protein